ncbi:MAG: hypothetical protein COS11_01770, partial [bacterium (Candidatus Ratteibacteria) CG01_land_8_20_14_3_00_40_19]
MKSLSFKEKILLLVSFLFLYIPGPLFCRDAFFEKGDTIYRKGFLVILGHAGLYKEWKDEDPDNYEEHKIIEIKGWGDVVEIDNGFDQFYNQGFWSVRTNNDIDCQQRRKIINIAKAQKDKKYNFFWGYKGPNTFRCDGLVEYCYEQAGIDIVPGDTWSPIIALFPGRILLTPEVQMKRQSVRTSAQLEEITFHKEGEIEVGEAITPKIKYEDGKYHVKDTVSIKFYASDGSVGSGLTRAELWLGYPDDTPDFLPGKRIYEDDSNHDVDHLYTASFDTTTVDNGEYNLYAKAFDQAGNYKIASVPAVIENVAAIEKLFSWQGYDLRLTFSRDPKGPIYTIYYKEKAEDSWTKWGEYDTKDSGLYAGDIILNLALNIPEYESEADDAGRFTHQCKLTAIGKDVFKDAYGYQTKRLIVDTTADWNAGEKNGITVVDEIHPTGQQKKGYIEPHFGTLQSISSFYSQQSYIGMEWAPAGYFNGNREHDKPIFDKIIARALTPDGPRSCPYLSCPAVGAVSNTGPYGSGSWGASRGTMTISVPKVIDGKDVNIKRIGYVPRGADSYGSFIHYMRSTPGGGTFDSHTGQDPNYYDDIGSLPAGTPGVWTYVIGSGAMEFAHEEGDYYKFHFAIRREHNENPSYYWDKMYWGGYPGYCWMIAGICRVDTSCNFYNRKVDYLIEDNG